MIEGLTHPIWSLATLKGAQTPAGDQWFGPFIHTNNKNICNGSETLYRYVFLLEIKHYINVSEQIYTFHLLKAQSKI